MQCNYRKSIEVCMPCEETVHLVKRSRSYVLHPHQGQPELLDGHRSTCKGKRGGGDLKSEREVYRERSSSLIIVICITGVLRPKVSLEQCSTEVCALPSSWFRWVRCAKEELHGGRGWSTLVSLGTQQNPRHGSALMLLLLAEACPQPPGAEPSFLCNYTLELIITSLEERFSYVSVSLLFALP